MKNAFDRLDLDKERIRELNIRQLKLHKLKCKEKTKCKNPEKNIQKWQENIKWYNIHTIYILGKYMREES